MYVFTKYPVDAFKRRQISYQCIGIQFIDDCLVSFAVGSTCKWVVIFARPPKTNIVMVLEVANL